MWFFYGSHIWQANSRTGQTIAEYAILQLSKFEYLKILLKEYNTDNVDLTMTVGRKFLHILKIKTWTLIIGTYIKVFNVFFH